VWSAFLALKYRVFSAIYEPLEDLLDRFNTWEGTPWQFKGNFRPTDKETHQQITAIDLTFGQIPHDIKGVYLRNGPNAQLQSRTNRQHLFDGDAMVHALRFDGKKIEYCNRQLRTPKFVQENEEYGRPIYFKVGELPGIRIWDSVKRSLNALKISLIHTAQFIGVKPYLPLEKDGTMNTALVHHNKKTFALLECKLPFGIKVN
jgi:hypothetical protein